MKLLSRRVFQSVMPYLLVGVVLTGFYLIWLQNQTPVSGVGLAFAVVYLWLLFSLAAYLLWRYFFAPRLRAYSPRYTAVWLAACLLVGVWLADNLPVVLPSAGIFKLVLFVCAGLGLGMVLFTSTVWLVTRPAAVAEARARRYRWLAFAAPMLLTWFVALLAFWPGLMSADSINQWGQVVSGQFSDHHPAFHTFLIWLLTRLVASPAIVALAQVAALALVVGMLLAYIESLGVAAIWVWVASLLFALSPVNATMVNTLWKDIPYSIAMLAFTYCILRLAQSRGAWLEGSGKWLLLGALAALGPLFRHNALPIILITFPALLLAFWWQRRTLFMAFALFAVLYFGITGPLYQLARVEKSNDLLEAATSLYGIAASADPGSRADGILRTMNPLSNEWQCSVGNDLMQARLDDGEGAVESLPEKVTNLVVRGPALLAYDYRCNRSLAWIVWDPNGELRNPSHAEYGIDPNPYGLVSQSKIPVLQTTLKDFVAQTAYNPGFNWWLWRPALYQYIFLLAVAVAAMCQRNVWILLIALPVVLESISFTLVTMPPNFRYHYLVYVSALAFWPLLFVPARTADPASPAAETDRVRR